MTDADFSTLIADTADAEGCSLTAYQDAVGVWTIGYGTNLQELQIDQPTAEQWLTSKLAQSEHEAHAFPWYAALSGARQRAIVEMVYNLGLTRFLGFKKMIAALASGEFVTAAAEALDSQWARQVGPHRSQRLADQIAKG